MPKLRRRLYIWALRVRHGKGIKVTDTREEILSKEGNHSEEEESDLCLEGDMMELAGRDMIGRLSEIPPLFGDQIPEGGQTLEEETDFVGIDPELQIGLQISQNVLDVSVKLARR